MLESLLHTAQDTKHERQNVYRLVYQTVSGKMDMPHDHLKALILRLLGDKDHENIFNVVTKVGKYYRQKSCDGVTITPYDKGEIVGVTHGTLQGTIQQAVTTVVNSAILRSIVIKGKGIFLLWKRRMARLSLQRSHKRTMQ